MAQSFVDPVEYANLSRPGQREIQGDLLYDDRANVASYPRWQAWLREHQAPTLVVWGEHAPSFVARVQEPSGGICRMRRSTSLTPGTSPWTKRRNKIETLILQFMAKHPG